MLNEEKLKNIKLFVMDVDGTLTDGKIYMGPNGEVMKAFNIKDGLGIRLLIDNGIVPAIITGRKSDIVLNRAKELGITEIYQGIDDKIQTYEELRDKYRITNEEVAYIGDDLNDLGVLNKVGVKFAVGDCIKDLKSKVDYVCEAYGGQGAVREAIDIIISKKY